jgi:DNA polymerase elongation subunit (family B)
MTNFYTNVQCIGNNILYRGIVNGKKVCKKIEYQPKLYEPVNKVTKFTGLSGEYLHEFKFDSIREARDYVKRNEDVENKKVYGNTRFEYCFIADTHPKEVEWDQSKISIATIDIEVGSENGFPDPYNATEAITAITLKFMGGMTFVFGCGDYKTDSGAITYIKCKDEWTLCKKFLEIWTSRYPDIITGWNIKFFDFPYLINRFKRIVGERDAKSLSPWNYISERKAVLMAKEHTVYEMVGIAMLDYIELYRKYAPGGASQESYKLDSIASVELGKNKIAYDEYDSLHELYKLNYQKFIEYNIRDVDLVEELEDKLKLIELALTLAYDSKTNYDDVFAQVRMWDTLIYNHLKNENIIIPPRIVSRKDQAYEGAYVKEPQVGKHDWIASFDLNSLYPHLIMQYNISPETLVEKEDYTTEMIELSSITSVNNLLNMKVDTEILKNLQKTITPNGEFFRTDIQGFLPKMMEKMYEDRKVYKKKALVSKQELEKETDKKARFEIEKRIARYNNLQLAKKVCLNSAYGALGNEFFRFFDVRQASAITLAGQLSIRWIEKKLNEYMNKLLETKNEDFVIASDTDSIYLRLGELVDKVYKSERDPEKIITFMDKVCENKIQPFIDESYQTLADYTNAYDQKMQMKREALANKGIWTAKKRYILNVYNNEGIQYSQPKMKVMGLEMVKSSTPMPIREMMEKSVDIMLNGTENELHTYVAESKSKFKKLPPEEISFPRGIRGISKYSDAVTLYTKGTPIHVKGAIIYNNAIKNKGLNKKYPFINEGEKIKFSYLKMPNPFKETVISFPVRLPKEFDLEKYIDYDMQFEKAFVEPVRVISDCIGWTLEKQSSLEDFFA